MTTQSTKGSARPSDSPQAKVSPEELMYVYQEQVTLVSLLPSAIGWEQPRGIEATAQIQDGIQSSPALQVYNPLCSWRCEAQLLGHCRYLFPVSLLQYPLQSPTHYPMDLTLVQSFKLPSLESSPPSEISTPLPFSVSSTCSSKFVTFLFYRLIQICIIHHNFQVYKKTRLCLHSGN